jgi:hypothetical protein
MELMCTILRKCCIPLLKRLSFPRVISNCGPASCEKDGYLMNTKVIGQPKPKNEI